MKRTVYVMKCIVGILLGSITGFLANQQYFYQFADMAQRLLGLSIAYFGVPFVISLALGGVATVIIVVVGDNEPILARFKKYWPVLLLSTVLSYSATIIVLWITLDAMDRM